MAVYNKLSQWCHLHTLGTVFPSLRHLMASSNPLTFVPPQDKMAPFPHLSILNLNNTLIGSWDSVDHLSTLPSLTELNILNIPIGRNLDEKERRFEAIGRLPQLRLLNKSVISVEEREDAERWLVRKYREPSNHAPATCPTLLEKHGPLAPLVNISMAPACDVDLEFYFNGQGPEVHRISLYRSTYDLKVWLSKMTKVAPSAMTLFYGDIETIVVTGLEEMRYGSKALYTYRMKKGDHIYVEFK